MSQRRHVGDIKFRVGDLVWRPDSDHPEALAVVLGAIELPTAPSTWVTIFWTRWDRSSVTDVPAYFLDHLVPEEKR